MTWWLLWRGPTWGGPGAFDHKEQLIAAAQATPDEDWMGWLQGKGLWDTSQGEEAMYIRYKRFRGMRFGLVAEGD